MSRDLFMQQRGAVLIFSLLILLLLTLASISMIRQNKTELAITGNMGEQIKTFARAETALRIAEATIQLMRQPNKDNASTPPEDRDDCSTSGRLFEGTGLELPDVPQATVIINKVSCVINGLEHTCSGNNGYVPAIDSTAAKAACEKLTDAQCPTEVYTIDLTFTHSQSETERTIRSQYSVGCSVFVS